MPWKIEKRDGKTCVVRADTGKTMHCYPGTDSSAESKAKDYMRALYAHAPESGKSFEVYKSGPEYRWRGFPTVNVWDREQELASASFVEELFEREKSRGFYPPLEWVHQGVAIGKADWYDVIDGVTAATGVFRNDPVSQAFARFAYEHPEGIDGSGLGMSWRYKAWPDRDGVYRRPASYLREFSLVPMSRAVNQDTKFQVEVTKDMKLSENDEKDLKRVLADPALRAVYETAFEAQAKSKALDEAGVERKSVDEAAPPEQAKADVGTGTDTQSAHGPGGVANQPGVEKAEKAKCAKCGHPDHDAKTCTSKDCNCKGAEAKKATDEEDTLSDEVIQAIARFVNEKAEEKAKAFDEEVAKAVNEALEHVVDAINAVNDRLDKMDERDKAMTDEYVTPRQTSLYERMKAASVTASPETIVKDGDPLLAATKEKVPADPKDERDPFVQGGLK